MSYFNLENDLFLLLFLTGTVFVVVGLFMLKFPPKDINGLYGYRTSSSMKNQERWDFSQIYAAKEMMKIGAIKLVIGLLALLFFPSEIVGVILGLGVLIVSCVLLVVRVEPVINNKFNEGN